MKEANICKFVTDSTEKQLTTINFVLEQTAANSNGKLLRSYDTMYLIISGTGRLITDMQCEELTAGTLFFTFTGIPFTLEGTDSLVYMYISFRGRRAAALYEQIGITHERCVFPGYAGLVSFWKNAILRAVDSNLGLISESVLLYTFSQMIIPVGQEKENLIGNIIHLIDTEFTDSSFTLESCAGKLGYNPKYISRIFSERVGVTFSEYLKDTRMKHAVFLIEQGVCIVKNIAFLSGYNDSLYFSHVFHQTIGMTPSEYILMRGKTKS